MPELPEIEHLRTSLLPGLLGAQVLATHLLRATIVRNRPSRRPTPEWMDSIMTGRTIHGIDRLGKSLAIRLDAGIVLCAHMGMTGQLRIRSNDQTHQPLPDHVHCVWLVQQPSGRSATLYFRDPRRFGGLWLEQLGSDQQQPTTWQRLGPDAAHIDPDRFFHQLHARKRPIKAALLDQSIVAGIGNIYADESLFHARIAPQSSCDAIPKSAFESLADTVRSTLAAAIKAGGSSLRDYVDADGACGNFVQQHAVYGRAGEPCIRCGRPLKTAQVGQRTTVWCAKCQPRFKRRSPSVRARLSTTRSQAS